jgi:hypothetical protein
MAWVGFRSIDSLLTSKLILYSVLLVYPFFIVILLLSEVFLQFLNFIIIRLEDGLTLRKTFNTKQFINSTAFMVKVSQDHAVIIHAPIFSSLVLVLVILNVLFTQFSMTHSYGRSSVKVEILKKFTGKEETFLDNFVELFRVD